MSLPVPSPLAARAVAQSLPAAQRSAVRQEALSHAYEMVGVLREVANDPTAPKAAVVQAAKAVLAVSALLNSSNLPRDVVKEKFELTVDLIRAFVPEHRWTEFAARLTPIWSDV